VRSVISVSGMTSPRPTRNNDDGEDAVRRGLSASLTGAVPAAHFGSADMSWIALTRIISPSGAWPSRPT
jgi:hypothetical protein